MGKSGIVTGIFLQARLRSQRLPEKALLKVAGLTIIEHAMQALAGVKADVYALLTDKHSAPVFKAYTAKWGFELFSGPSLDVLKRYCMAADHFGVTRVVRATGDNPLVSAELTGLNLREHGNRHADLSRFIGGPLGTGVEVVEAEALQRSCGESQDRYEHEHITTHILRNRQKYSVHELTCPENCCLAGARVTLDTEADFKVIEAVYQALYTGKPIHIKDLVLWLKQHKELWNSQQKKIKAGTSFSSRQ
ncbi:MAG: acylneuraminate cytidylyltransferase [Spirochaetales bacterium]|nr:acylneuraminate cytidylyltransferase [Spirochaetales bacterium]